MLPWTKIKQKNLQICIDHTPSCIYFCKKKRTQEGAWLLCIFFCNHNYQGGTDEFIYKASILSNKQLLLNMIDHETIKVPHTTRIAFLTNRYIFCSNYPAIFCIIVIASYIASQLAILLYKGSTVEQRLMQSSQLYRFLAKQQNLQI